MKTWKKEPLQGCSVDKRQSPALEHVGLVRSVGVIEGPQNSDMVYLSGRLLVKRLLLGIPEINRIG